MKRRKCQTKALHDGHEWKRSGLFVVYRARGYVGPVEDTYWCPGRTKAGKE